MKNWLVIDCNYLGHQMRWATGEMTNGDEDTGVIFGFFSVLLNLVETYRTDKILFVWDSKKSKRSKIFPEYKKKRKTEMTDEEREGRKKAYRQFDLLRTRILPSLGFKNVYIQAGYEGDDIMAKIALDPVHKSKNLIMYASDHDLYQLLSDNVSLLAGKKMYKEKDFLTEFGISPRQWGEVKAIGGCKSDEVPGISGVGEKTVCKYLKGELNPKTATYKKIASKEGLAVAEFNRPLVVLPFKGTKVPEVLEDDLDFVAFKKMCKEYGFRGFLKDRRDEWLRLFKGHWR